MTEQNAITSGMMLVTLNVSDWRARKLDKAETKALNQMKDAKDNAGRVFKTLLPNSINHDNLMTQKGKIRNYIYAQTLPWAVDGSRVLPVDRYLDVASTLGEMIDEWKALLQKFLDGYAEDVQRATRPYPDGLGGLFKQEDYPRTDDIAHLFNISVGFMPVPSADDWRVELAEEEMEILRKNVEAQAAAGNERMMQEAWHRVHDVCKRAHDRLSDEKGRFTSTLVTNALDLADLLPSFNVTNDPELTAAAKAIQKAFANVDAEDLKAAPTVRQKVAEDVGTILDDYSHLFK
jgi:hypothetical protein